MTYKIDASLCIGCGSCSDSCSVNAIISSNSIYSIVKNMCTGCGSCASACPVDAITEISDK